MHKFLKRYKLPKQSQEEINNMSSSILVKEIESVDKYVPTLLPFSLPQKNTPHSDSFTHETKHLRRKLYECSTKSSRKLKRRKSLIS